MSQAGQQERYGGLACQQFQFLFRALSLNQAFICRASAGDVGDVDEISGGGSVLS